MGLVMQLSHSKQSAATARASHTSTVIRCLTRAPLATAPKLPPTPKLHYEVFLFIEPGWRCARVCARQHGFRPDVIVIII